jgi:2-oxoglutarate dehydrogenase E1 component
VLDDPRAQDRKDKVTRLVLCTGKVAIDLEQSTARDTESVAVARVEMLAPFQTGPLRDVINSYPNLQEIVWLQEEPRNMGAWTYMGYRLRDLVGDAIPVRYIGRPGQASPAEGYAEKHKENQARIVAAAFADVIPADTVTVEASSQQGNGQDDRHAARQRAEIAVGTAD